MNARLLFRAAALLWAGWTLPAQAEDIDLFNGDPANRAPANVLIILDNTANWGATAKNWSSAYCGSDGKKFCYEKEALAKVIPTLAGAKGINVGLMLLSDIADGGYVRYALRDQGTQANNDSLVKLINALTNATLTTRYTPSGGPDNLLYAALSALSRPAWAAGATDKGNNAAYALAMHEAYLYFQGETPRSGNHPRMDNGQIKSADGTVLTDFGDGGAFDGGKYKRPAASQCPDRNFIIFISNGAPDVSEDGKAEALLSGLGGTLNSDPIPLSPNGREDNWSDEYARYLTGNSLRTYTIDVAPTKTGQGPDNTALLSSMAVQGRGQYFAANSVEELTTNLLQIFKQIQAINNVFASVALPVSINVRGTHLNQVYMGTFRPDNKPRWFGNMKLFQLNVTQNSELYLVDSSGTRPVQDPSTGFVADDAVSFWTESSDFWDYRCSGAEPDPTLCGDPATGSDLPDGAVVEKGAAGQKLRLAVAASPAERKLYTCVGSCTGGSLLGSASGTVFEANNAGITQADLKAADATERTKLIEWVRGLDNTSPAEKAAGGVRPSIVGDVLHSRPVVVNYNRGASGCSDEDQGDKDIVVFYGTNDGLVRALKGSKAETAANGLSGEELWGFIPKEFFGRLKRQRDNAPEVIYPAPVPAGANNKDYFADGNFSVYSKDVNGDCKLVAADGDKTYLYVTMRRGGRYLYAFDVSIPEAPKLLWKKDHTSTGYSELGQTWSEMKPITLEDGKPALIFGAGYDPAAHDQPYDTDNHVYKAALAANATMGRGVFVADALTGEVIRHFGPEDDMDDPVPSDLNVLTTRSTGVVSRAYVGDTGGHVWRIDLTDQNPGDKTVKPGEWTLTKLAQLGGTGIYNRKFLYPPDLVRISGGYALMLGSGDREHPFDKTVLNRFYMIKDLGANTTLQCAGDESTCDLYNVTTNSTVPADTKGWYITLREGEKVVGGSITLAGTTFFPTSQPTAINVGGNECVGNLGTARIYVVDYKTGAPAVSGDTPSVIEDRDLEVPGGGLPPTPMPVIVQIDSGAAAGGVNTGEYRMYMGVVSGTTALDAPNTGLERRRLVYWFKEASD
jgi:type IV pilus assembly protein PilY1